MKSKCVLIVVFAAMRCCGEISTDDPTSLLRSEWGKGTVADFRKIAYENIPLVFKRGGAAAVEKWCAELVDYPDFWKETETVYWMEAKASTLSFCLKMRFVEASTNCWFAAAELLNRYRAFVQEAESNANFKADVSLIKTDPKRFNEILYSRKPLKIKAWNLKHAETSLARVVTNEFPKSILPRLPEAERDKMLSDVLERSGVVDADKDSAREASIRVSRGFIMLGAVALFVLTGSLVFLRRLKSSKSACRARRRGGLRSRRVCG